MKLLKDFHSIEIIDMDDDLQEIVRKDFFRVMIIDRGGLLGDQDIRFFIVGQRKEIFGIEDIGLEEQLFISGISLKDDDVTLF